MSTSGNITQYDLIGKKEDVSDIITNIAPTKTPFQTIIGSETVHQVLHQWQEDSLIDAAANNAIEGANAATAVSNPTSLRSNYTQILTKTAATTGTADATKTYGRAKELSYQLALRSTELKRDLEFSMVGRSQAATAGSSGAARKMAAYINQLDSTTYALNGGTPRALSETLVLTLAQTLFNAGADPDTLMIKPNDATIVSAFMAASGRTKYYTQDQKKVVNAVDYYESPYGVLRVVMNRFQLTSTALMFEPDMWKKLTLRNWFRQQLAKTGDSTQVQILGEFSLKHRNFLASGAIGDLS